MTAGDWGFAACLAAVGLTLLPILLYGFAQWLGAVLVAWDVVRETWRNG